MARAILALNTGSSSIKFAAYAVDDSELKPVCRGLLDHHAGDSHFVVKDAAGKILEDSQSGGPGSQPDFAATLLARVERLLGDHQLVGVGHRIVHGGPEFYRPVKIDPAVVRALEALTPLAPLHQPGCLAPVRSLLSARPQLPQVACFDTAFHHDLAAVYRRFPLPAEFEAKGLRRYGFHGLSFEHIVERLGRPQNRLVVAHLGSGSSLCAIRDGRSVNTSMSLTPLDGLMMATRSGAIDPGLVLYLLQSERMSAPSVEDLLYHKSGLAGLSGISPDMRTLLASHDPGAGEAVDQFCARAAEQIVAMATAIDGIDVLVFTGGIGENSPEIRENICARLRWTGVMLDRQANSGRRELVSASTSPIEVRVVATDEENVIARHTLQTI
jgi:acetate kinase